MSTTAPSFSHRLHVKGMSCQHCVKGVTLAIQALDPQAQVQVDLPSGQVQVQTHLSREAVATAVTDEGHEVIG
ncbi:MAG: heavy-metal-associated domain-containing protein [Burkholderiales bacterium]|nr:heavy-metal-associated domain-containing protein [Burkholderiales bacterium]MBH2017011.1 heavy-metal-associated domain-containing protein [Burkholderiales bacterium]